MNKLKQQKISNGIYIKVLIKLQHIHIAKKKKQWESKFTYIHTYPSKLWHQNIQNCINHLKKINIKTQFQGIKSIHILFNNSMHHATLFDNEDPTCIHT